MPESILITGGSGLLGINWAVAARNRYDITLGVHMRAVSLAGVQSRVLDLESVDAIAHVLKAMRPKFVVHAAGLTSVEKCELEPTLARHVNVDIARNVSRACSSLGIKFVHISTDHLFPGDEKLVTEEQPVFPLNVYSRTKAEAELAVLQESPKSLVIRTNFYGWGTTYRQSFSDFIINALRCKNGLTLFKDVFYTPILIEELVKTVNELADSDAFGLFNVVGDDRISKYEFGMKIAEAFDLDGSAISPGYFDNQVDLVKRPKDMSLSNFKVCNFLGRPLGCVDDHIKRLRAQQLTGLTHEIQAL